MINKRFIFFLFLSYLIKCEPARILAALPIPMISHQMVFRVLLEELAKRGHEVTVITGLPIHPKGQSPANYTEIDVSEATHDIRVNLLKKEIKITDFVSQFETTYKATTGVVYNVLGMKVVKDLIRDKSRYFDLVILEDCAKPSLVFSYLFKAPVILISSFGGTFETFEIVGAATHPFIYPLSVRQRYGDLSVWDKISELYLEYRIQQAYNTQRRLENEMIKEYLGINSPTIDDLKKNVQMVFLNIHPIWDSNRPVPPNVVYLGGLHQKPEQELPKDLKSSLDNSTNGVIYVSFGTNIGSEMLSPEKLQIFIKVFSKLPYDIYWKWNDNNLPGLTKNIKIMKWFPQSDLLSYGFVELKKLKHRQQLDSRNLLASSGYGYFNKSSPQDLGHPKVKLFVTQGGLQSTDEAIEAGVPLIGIPMMWDQWYNVNKYEQLKIGLQLDINTFTESTLRKAIETVIENKSYKENITKLYSVMRDQIQSPLERAVWWTEYLLRHHGADHLRAPTANLPWTKYYEIELILLVVTSIILSVGIFSFAILNASRICVRKSKID